MVSGYTENHRKEAIQCTVVGYERMVERDAKRKKRLVKKVAWYRPQDTVIFVPTTPNGELAMKVRKVVQEEGRRINIKVRVVETAGTPLRQKLVRTDLAPRTIEVVPCTKGHVKYVRRTTSEQSTMEKLDTQHTQEHKSMRKRSRTRTATTHLLNI